MKPRIGMRNIKTALSVCLCVLISGLAGLDSPFYAAIAAVITMQNTIVSTFETGRTRMLGTVVGAGTGLLFASIMPGNAFLCGVGIILMIFLCDLFRWNSAIAIAGIVFMAIMVNMNGKNPLAYSMNRLLDTLIGISVALLVNYLVWPYDPLKQMDVKMQSLRRQLEDAARSALCLGECRPLTSEAKALRELESSLEAAGKEVRTRRKGSAELAAMTAGYEELSEIKQHLTVMQALRTDFCPDESLKARFDALGFPTPAQCRRPEGREAEAFMWHAEQLLGLLETSVQRRNKI